jgi:hypothetical protein
MRQYVRPDNGDPDYLREAEAVLSGKIHNRWVNQYNRKVFAKKRLVKAIRANLFLKWINVHFPKIPILLILRHPCAVACSRMKFGWKPGLEELLSQMDLVEDFLKPFVHEIKDVQSDFEKHVLLWCIQNYVPLKQFTPGDLHIVFYENLCISPGQEIKRLFEFIHKPYDSQMLAGVSRPSLVSTRDSAIVSRKNPAESYKAKLEKPEIHRAIQLLELFGLERIYGPNPMPKVAGRECLAVFK